jgi:hypothetical protein
MARLEANGIPVTWVDAWVDWWEARDAKSNRHHPGCWEQAVQHIAGEWDEGRTVPPAADVPSEERNKIR